MVRKNMAIGKIIPNPEIKAKAKNISPKITPLLHEDKTNRKLGNQKNKIDFNFQVNYSDHTVYLSF